MSDQVFVFGDLVVDVPAHRVRLQGRDVRLTAKPFEILACLARAPGNFLTYDGIASCAWRDPTSAPSTELIRRHISDIRRRIGSEYIQTEAGAGCRLVAPARAEPNGKREPIEHTGRSRRRRLLWSGVLPTLAGALTLTWLALPPRVTVTDPAPNGARIETNSICQREVRVKIDRLYLFSKIRLSIRTTEWFDQETESLGSGRGGTAILYGYFAGQNDLNRHEVKVELLEFGGIRRATARVRDVVRTNPCTNA